MDIVLDILSKVNSPEIQQKLWLPRLILGGVGIFFFGLAVFLFFYSSWAKFKVFYDAVEFFTFRAFGITKRTRVWQKIMRRLETRNEAEYKLAIIEAEALLDEALKRMGFRGETLGDRLKEVTPVIIPNLEDLGKAHKIRNNVVHDPDYRLSFEEAQEVMRIYEQVFRNLDLI